jgi:putative ABC transport system ATP-binding protein
MSEVPSVMEAELPEVSVVSAALVRNSVEAHDLEVAYRSGALELEVRALRRLSLELREGSFTAVMGPSGCGKSTLLHALGGLLTPTSGTLRVCGADFAAMSDKERTRLRRREIGVVFQRFNLLPALTVEGNLRLAERISLGFRDPARGRERRLGLLGQLGLLDKRRRRPNELSGGEQQRLAIARAILHAPSLLLADEPTGSLDSRNAHRVLDVLEQLHRNNPLTIALITHDGEVASRADRVVVMRDGIVVDERGDP